MAALTDFAISTVRASAYDIRRLSSPHAEVSICCCDLFAGGAAHDDMTVPVMKFRRPFECPGAEWLIPGAAYPMGGEQRRELLEQ
jgi:hypothetical protein